MEKNIRTYRMMGLVPYNLSPIQKGIQFGHAVVEYANHYFNETVYQSWALYDKTFIILDGGTTNINPTKLGTLNQHLQTLVTNEIKLATFYEPDLGDQLTAIVFIVDDRVFDRKAWPDLDDPLFYEEWKNHFSSSEKEAEEIIFLRQFLRSFKLA